MIHFQLHALLSTDHRYLCFSCIRAIPISKRSCNKNIWRHKPDLSMTMINSWLLLNSDSLNWGKKFNIITSWHRIPSKNNTVYTKIHYIHVNFSTKQKSVQQPYHLHSAATSLMTLQAYQIWLSWFNAYFICRDQPNSRGKMCDFTVEFLKCAKFHGKFTEGVSEIHGKFMGPTAVISRCYVTAN